MSTPIEPWTRPLLRGPAAPASVSLFAFARGQLDLSSPLSRGDHGLPVGHSIESVDLRQHPRAEDAEWFDGFFTESMLAGAEHDLRKAYSALGEAQTVYSIRTNVVSPTDLGYLQTAWATARWLCELGAIAVLDVHSAKWHGATDLLKLKPTRAFDVQHEVMFVFESDPTEGFGHVTHTRGLAKFGRPDILLFGLEPAEATAAADLLNALAHRAAVGAEFKQGQTVGSTGLPPRPLWAYLPEQLHPQVHLNNEGLVLNVEGWGLADLAG